jgi:hypothetical protein
VVVARVKILVTMLNDLGRPAEGARAGGKGEAPHQFGEGHWPFAGALDVN